MRGVIADAMAAGSMRWSRPAIHRHRHATQHREGRRRRHHRVGREDDFVTRPEPRRAERHRQAVGRIAHANHMACVQEFGEVRLEARKVLLHDECATMHDVAKDPDEFVFLP